MYQAERHITTYHSTTSYHGKVDHSKVHYITAYHMSWEYISLSLWVYAYGVAQQPIPHHITTYSCTLPPHSPSPCSSKLTRTDESDPHHSWVLYHLQQSSVWVRDPHGAQDYDILCCASKHYTTALAYYAMHRAAPHHDMLKQATLCHIVPHHSTYFKPRYTIVSIISYHGDSISHHVAAHHTTSYHHSTTHLIIAFHVTAHRSSVHHIILQRILIQHSRPYVSTSYLGRMHRVK